MTSESDNTSHTISNYIYSIRGYQVMLDTDLALLYGTETRILNQVVQRNKQRFPSDFAFKLTPEEVQNIKVNPPNSEVNNLRSQIVISSLDDNHMKLLDYKEVDSENPNLRSQIVTSSWGGRRHTPYAFTEQGVGMLSGVLNSNQAMDIHVSIMRAFVRLRKEELGASTVFDKRTQAFEAKLDQKFDTLSKQLIEVLREKSFVAPNHQISSQFQIPTNHLKDGNAFKMQSVHDLVADYFKISKQNLKRQTREKEFSFPRQIAMYLLRAKWGFSFKEIAKFYGRDHTTVIYAYKKINEEIKKNVELSKTISKFLNIVTLK